MDHTKFPFFLQWNCRGLRANLTDLKVLLEEHQPTAVCLQETLISVLRVAARLVLRKRKFDPISADIRDRLHWLPIRSRIDFKLGLLVYKCLQGTAPGYLTEMLVQKSTVPALSRLRSTARGDLLVPRTKTKTIGPRSFATSGPALWNSLPDDLRDPSLSLTVFKQKLKSYLFKQC